MAEQRRLSLGLDSSTQGIKAVVIDVDSGQTVYENALSYDEDPRLAKYNVDGSIFMPSKLGLAEQDPRMFVASLDAIFEDMGRSEEFDMGEIRVINDSGQQHGHVYLNGQSRQKFAQLQTGDSASSNLTTILDGCFSYPGAPIWKTDNTQAEADYLRQAAGGKEQMIRLTGSDSPLRFTAAQMMMIGRYMPETIADTETVQLISSFIPAILAANTRSPLDIGNGAGTSIMDYAQRTNSQVMIEAAARYCRIESWDFASKLPGLTAPNSIVGMASKYLQQKYGFRADCMVTAGSGDNPQLKVMTEDDLLTLGTSGVYIISTDGNTFDMTGVGNAMYDGLGRPLLFRCRSNCATGMDRIRAVNGLGPKDYATADDAIEQEPFGKYIYIWHPDGAETLPISPMLEEPYVEGFGSSGGLGPEYAGVVDSVIGAIRAYSGSDESDSKKPLLLSGGPSNSRQIKLRASGIFGGRPVISMGDVELHLVQLLQVLMLI